MVPVEVSITTSGYTSGRPWALRQPSPWPGGAPRNSSERIFSAASAAWLDEFTGSLM